MGLCFRGLTHYYEEVTLKNIQSNVEVEMDKLNNPIIAEGESKSLTVLNNAISIAEESIASKKSDSEKIEAAIDLFRGFYLINVKSRPKFCLKYNVQIDSFVRAFEKEHAKEYAFMSKYESSSNQFPPQFYELLNDLLDKQVETEINNSTKEYGLSTEEICQSFQTNAIQYVERIKLSKRMPEIHQLLSK